MLNQNRNPLLERHTTRVNTFSAYNQNDIYGYPNFVKRSIFESVLEDDCLMVCCTVSVVKDFPVELDFPLLVPPPLALQQLSHLLETGYGADVTFQVKGETFNAHKCILAMRSQVFQAQFFGQLKEKSGTVINIEDMEAHVFKSLLHFIYSETIPEFQEINESEKIHLAQHLLVAADRYDLNRLKVICENILYGTIDKSNVVALFSFADMHNCVHLKRACLKSLASPEILEEVVATKKLKVAP
ncbi:BTB/POZ and MATH domain-containing protein 2 [Rhynchospora pubera]|uniref:BTB/POZ and MATH domain-containing protein 2 n=1 Tax=Rhynchospora pubera TaxID=906938 RepID=A0AAV8FG53_9POAL|nr:BTB/POZ and MATH domain-containing protein 2 [Rhynchospora pubera]KAJ4809216.1 BTB/POZ and MATH domain-containing protein 2 [Rhynchospora pubera]